MIVRKYIHTNQVIDKITTVFHSSWYWVGAKGTTEIHRFISYKIAHINEISCLIISTLVNYSSKMYD